MKKEEIITTLTILLTKMEGIEDLKPEEKNLLTKSLTKEYFEVYIWLDNSKDIP